MQLPSQTGDWHRQEQAAGASTLRDLHPAEVAEAVEDIHWHFPLPAAAPAGHHPLLPGQVQMDSYGFHGTYGQLYMAWNILSGIDCQVQRARYKYTGKDGVVQLTLYRWSFSEGQVQMVSYK